MFCSQQDSFNKNRLCSTPAAYTILFDKTVWNMSMGLLFSNHMWMHRKIGKVGDPPPCQPPCHTSSLCFPLVCTVVPLNCCQNLAENSNKDFFIFGPLRWLCPIYNFLSFLLPLISRARAHLCFAYCFSNLLYMI